MQGDTKKKKERVFTLKAIPLHPNKTVMELQVHIIKNYIEFKIL